jgi:hypothetical protein
VRDGRERLELLRSDAARRDREMLDRILQDSAGPESDSRQVTEVARELDGDIDALR